MPGAAPIIFCRTQKGIGRKPRGTVRVIAPASNRQADSIDGKGGDFLSLMIAGGALSAWIENRFAIHQETVVVLTTVERDFEQPAAIRLAFHRVGHGIPIIKIADQMHLT